MTIAIEHDVRGWTVADVLALPESNDRYELLEGSLIVSAYANVPHQIASRDLHLLLEDAVFAAEERLRVLTTVNVEVPRD